MGTRAVGAFGIEAWDEQPFDERERARLTRARVVKNYTGDIEGESTTDLLFAYGSEEGSAAYVGFERVVGRVRGRSGSFVLHHSAVSSRGERPDAAVLFVVPDSATGELEGLKGEARVSVGPDGGHSFALDYELG